MITTGSNTVSLGVQRRLNDVSRGLNTSFERLSSGLRINRASDDAAGLAIADSLNADSRVYGQAVRNINDGVSALSIADGALGQLSNIVIRQKELAEQAANGVYSTAQRNAMHVEANALVNEFNRIVGSTSFNGQNVLDGSYLNVSLQAGYGVNGGLRMGIGDDLQRAVGDGTFTIAATFTTTFYHTYVNSADFDGDGNNDLVAATGGTYLGIHRGNGDGTFLAPVTYNTNLPNGAVQMIVGDFNGDGHPDLFAPSYNINQVATVLINRGDGTFNTPTTNTAIPAGWNLLNTSAIGSGDFNGDGFDDVAITFNNASSEVAIYLSNGNGTFLAPITRSTGNSSTGGIIGDFNNDGLADIAVNDFGSNSISLVYGQRTGGVSSVTTLLTSPLLGFNNPAALTGGDFNRDGYQDIMVSNSVGTSRILLGSSSGTFTAGSSFTSGTYTFTSTSGDVNGDGYLDLILSNSISGAALTVLGNGDGTFKAPITINSGLNATGGGNIVARDFNNDGAIDLYSSNNAGQYSNVSLSNTTDTSYVGYLSLLTQDDARNTLTQLDQTLRRINLERGRVGSLQSRFSFASSVIQTSRTNYIGAESQIRDVDVADESAHLVRQQILQQAATAVLSQANQQPALTLKLLGNI